MTAYLPHSSPAAATTNTVCLTANHTHFCLDAICTHETLTLTKKSINLCKKYTVKPV